MESEKSGMALLHYGWHLLISVHPSKSLMGHKPKKGNNISILLMIFSLLPGTQSTFKLN
jgi:hypothetical protein